MIKILQINASSGFGGGEKVLYEIVKNLVGQFEFMVAAPAGFYTEKYNQLGIKFVAVDNDKILFSLLKQIKSIITAEKPNIIHCHGTRAAFWVRLVVLKLKSRPKIIYTLHGFHLPRKAIVIRHLFLLVERLLYKFVDVLINVSEADKNLVLQYNSMPRQKIMVINNGIDIKQYQPVEPVEQLKKEFAVENKFVILTAARLHPPKDFSTILRAIKILTTKIPDLILMIAGDGPLKAKIQVEISRLQLEEQVRLLGAREDIERLMVLSDVVVLSSRWEGAPLVPLEAGASSRPIISSEVAGIKEIIKDNQTGLLFKMGDAASLAEKILRLYQSVNLRNELGRNGYKYICENFSVEKMAAKHAHLYKSLV